MKGHVLLALISAASFASAQNAPPTPIETQTALVMHGRELTNASLVQGRDLKLYDDGGHFDCRDLALSDTVPRNCDLLKARDFIWKHWQQKRRGYIRVTFDSVDTMSTSHIFVEPDDHGVWVVVWRVAQARANGPSLIRDFSAFTTVGHLGSELTFTAKDGSKAQL